MENQCCCGMPDMGENKIRPAFDGDMPVIKDLIAKSISHFCSAHYTAEQIEKWIRHEQNKSVEQKAEDALWIALDQETIAGVMRLEHTPGVISSLFVHPEHARKKIGSSLIMYAHTMAYVAEALKLIVNAPINAVEFFRFHDYTENGSDFIALDDGTKLPCIKMEQPCYRYLEFSEAQTLSEQLLTTLKCDDRPCMLATLKKLREKAPTQLLDEIVRLLNDPDPTLHRLAGVALGTFSKLKGGEVTVEQKAKELVEYLMHGLDERARLSCAIHLMPIRSELVDRAFLHVLNDSSDKIAQLACSEVGWRGTSESAAALFGMLNHPVWDVRLTACTHLIQQGKADHRVVDILEVMGREPEGLAYDAKMAEMKEFMETIVQACSPNEPPSEVWDTFDSILNKAREVADKNAKIAQA